ncbi:MAG: hypothetical protein WBC33_12735, partial [Conexibacter sp.]
MERVSATAAALLRLGSAGSPHHAGWLARLEGPGTALDVPRLLDALAARLERSPRLRRVPSRAEDRSGALVW